MKKLLFILALLFSAPTYAATQIDLETQVKGVLPQANGGTGATSVLTISGTPAVGDLLYMTGSNTAALLTPGTNGDVLTSAGAATPPTWETPTSGSGTVTSVSVTTANGVSGSVANATTTPAISLTLGAITPSSVNNAGASIVGGLETLASEDVSGAGTTQGDGTQLSATKNIHNITGGASLSAVVLPAATAGQIHYVFNRSGNSIRVFPASGESIGVTSTNTNIIIGTGSSFLLVATSAGNWKVINVVSASADVNLIAGLDQNGVFSITSRLANRAWNGTAPTVSGFCTSPSVPANNGTFGFTVNVGTSCAGVSTGTITLPAATNGWVCHFANVSNPATSAPAQTGGTTTTATVTNYARTTGLAADWTDSDVIRVSCHGY